MEDNLNGSLSDVEVLDHMKNGVDLLTMAKFLEGNISNKEGNNQEKKLPDNDSYSSESDALVIDESIPSNNQKISKKEIRKSHTVVEGNGDESEILTHSNPFFNQSLFELSQLHQSNQKVDGLKVCIDDTEIETNQKYKRGKNKPKAKFQEYAQYLGLQPAIQFKCPKCGRAGFETLTALQEHVGECNEKNVQEITGSPSSGFKLTRKVFLCSACGTYYENWNLYMHMLEIHQRFICLYCLGMFSVLEDLCKHLQSKHNLQPGYKNNPDDFFNTYNEPCYLVCCECHKHFSEQDNFFYHNCNKNSVKCKKTVKTQIAPENHVTGETEAIENIFSKLNTGIEENKSCENSKGGAKIQETIETNSDNLLSNKSPHQNSNKTEHRIDSVGQKCIEEEEGWGDISSNIEENLDSEQSYTDSKLEVEETSCEKDPFKNYSDKEQDMEEYQEVSQELDFDKQLETRKVPKLSLKLPKSVQYLESAEESDDSEKLTMDQVESDHENSKDKIGHIASDNENVEEHEEQYDEEYEEITQEDEKEFFENYNELTEKEYIESSKPQIQVAGSDIQVIELILEQPLDKFDPRVLLQKCLKNTIQSCIYCNHARKIAVNGKQLALHCIAEHRFSAVVNSITAEELIPESFVNSLSESLGELDKSFFSLDSSFSNEAVTFSHLFECFQCYFSTTVHKELYLHNRKFHSKNLLLCIMCKSNFFSYSELICHLCPGVYVLDYDLQFRCCMCVNDDLPSSFRLMVHLRKKHNVCDVCLEMCHTQYRLSNHVWKHKLHHFCYRCGIAYRNKPDITRHLFWKHGTESVLCKKCLQKKWPHVYHFCVPPSSFTCEECGLNFIKAVSLKVHKRLHTNDKKHQCTFKECKETFISNKLRLKHEKVHYEPPVDIKMAEKVEEIDEQINGTLACETDEQAKEVSDEKCKTKMDVLDLPALNLSESDSSDSEIENSNHTPGQIPIVNKECNQGQEQNLGNNNSFSTCNVDLEKQNQSYSEVDGINQYDCQGNQNGIDVLDEPRDDFDHSNSVIQNIWDNFKNYQASKGKLDNLFTETERTEEPSSEEMNETEIDCQQVFTLEDALRDHDYCLVPEQTTDTTIIEVKPALTESVDHDYCSPKLEKISDKLAVNIEYSEKDDANIKTESSEKENKSQVSSSSSSDSDSSSCSCGSNCSCSSSSGSSSSSSNSSGSDSSTEEGRKRQQLVRKQRRKERAKKIKEIEKTTTSDVIVTPNVSSVGPLVCVDVPIQESDLDTTESETDEEFYDKAPQKLANKILEEKRQQLLSIMGPNNVPNGSFIESTSRPPTPPGEVVEEEERKKKKSKSKKRKKHKNERKEATVLVPPLNVPIPSYYQQFHQTFNQQQNETPPPSSPTTPIVSRNFEVATPLPATPVTSYLKDQIEPVEGKQESTDNTLRASKRRRVPNKFYGYSSDEEQEKSLIPKWRKTEPVTPRSPLIVPPITIKTTKQPTPPPPQVVEPISIRTGTHLSDFRVQRPRIRPPSIPPIKLLSGSKNDNDSASDSNDSSSEDQSSLPPKSSQPQLYCYCRCPYDEVSEMIGCDASDCAIEWFHFECVGIMVPPKGQWFCPDCRKKKQQKRDFFSAAARST